MQMISEPKLQVSLKSVSSRAKRNCLILELHRWTGDHPVLFLLHLLLTPGKKRDGKEVRVFFGDPFNKNLTWDPPPHLVSSKFKPVCVSQFFEFLKNCQFWLLKYLQNQRTVGSGSLENKFWLPSISSFHERTDSTYQPPTNNCSVGT